MNCSKHTKEVAGITDMAELAKMIGDLHYESLAEFLNELCLKINEDGTKDYNEGRKLLGNFLLECADNISEAGDCITAAVLNNQIGMLLNFAWEIEIIKV